MAIKNVLKICLIFIGLSMFLQAPQTILAKESNDTVDILFTHDLHDNFYPFEVSEGGETYTAGGYARLYTAIQQEKKEAPDALLVDAGDYSMGSLFQTINPTHAPELRMMGEMGYDVTTFGNHEFDFRPEGLADSLSAAKESGDPLPKIVASNTIFPDEENLTPSLKALKTSMNDYGVTEYTVMEHNGINIGFIGLMGEEADIDAPMAEVEFEPIVDNAKTTIKKMKKENDIDLVVALSHSGTSDNPKESEDEILAEKVPELDVIISGHSHTVLEEPIISGDTTIVSSGEYGKNLGKLSVSKDENDKWHVEDYDIIPINDQLAKDPKIAEKIEAFKKEVENTYLDRYDMAFDDILAYSPFSFIDFEELGEEHTESPLGNLIGDAYIHTVQEMEGEAYEPIAAAVVPVGTIRDSIVEGDITVSDVFNISPLGVGANGEPGYPLVDIYLNGEDLKTVAEVDASITPLMAEVQLYTAGLHYTFNPNRLIFNKVTNVTLDNDDGHDETIEDDKLYRVVAGLYSAQMLPIVGDKSFGLLSIVPRDKDGNPIEDFEKEIIYDHDDEELKEWYALAHYLESFEEVDATPELPDYYTESHNRKVVEQNNNIIALVKKPNGIALSLYGIGLGIIVIISLLVVWLVRRKKRKKKRGELRTKHRNISG